ncbi:GntR family transcriptional regulator [Pseudofrankia sp. BMG5.37]|uniref:GntR family transcriptional regulator n=1 Tax=Pseudofrankia sp. BMG5.37 TaxID=3050035 RepID=UPI00289530D5|nr:GntR family transcriptional regulator [Pseudofrankia sp. BMG5.37]MDT3444950.1 GntR family transcriptional regulator [Pseudofrankia sp. BMG5.37]
MQLPEEVATYVRELIISGAVRPGEFLRMERIAEALGVSNTPVREGLLTLRSEGFVRLEPRRGFVVAPFTQQDIRDLFWAQAELGSELAARAAMNMTPERLRVFEKNLEDYDRAIASDDKAAIAKIGHQFHREVNLAADSHRLALLQGAVVRHLPNRFYATIEGQVAGARAEHPMIVEAFRRGDARRARSLMAVHILEGADRLIDTLEKQGLWDPEGAEPASGTSPGRVS